MTYQANYPAPVPAKKSVFIAFLLTFFLGPLGLFYVGAVPGLVGLFILIPVGVIGSLFTFGIAGFVCWAIAVIWGCSAVSA